MSFPIAMQMPRSIESTLLPVSLRLPIFGGLHRFAAVGMLVCILSSLSAASMWTDRLGDFVRQDATPISMANAALAEEFGVEAAETANYLAGSRRFKATAYQTADSTTGTALYQSLLPPNAKPSEFEQKAIEEEFALASAESDTTTVVHYQNYVLLFEGDRPTWQVVKDYLGYAPKLGVSTPPSLPGYLPHDNRVAGSERYVLGPESLALYLKEVPPGIAAFSMGAEAQVAEYAEGDSRVKLAIISYPTPQMARKKLEEYQALGTPVVKREGSLIVFVPSPANRDLAERVLARVRYRATVTVNENTSSPALELRNLIINVIILSVLMVVLAGLVGLSLGGMRYLRRRNAPSDDEDFLRLHID